MVFSGDEPMALISQQAACIIESPKRFTTTTIGPVTLLLKEVVVSV